MIEMSPMSGSACCRALEILKLAPKSLFQFLPVHVPAKHYRNRDIGMSLPTIEQWAIISKEKFGPYRTVQKTPRLLAA